MTGWLRLSDTQRRAALWDVYREEYACMQEQMIYGEAMPFDDLLKGLQTLLGKFRAGVA
jgi:hypothetical protein